MENKLQSFVGKVRKSCEKYKLISESDTIAVGLSGGKDSLSLLLALCELQKYYPKKFSLIAICIDLGIENSDFSDLEKYCKSLNVPFVLYKSDIFDIVFNIRKEKNPCALCAKLRRGMLCSVAKSYGANKLALGHHSDDLIETFFLSLFYEGRLSTFAPKSYLSKSDITVIRPLLLCTEKDVVSVASREKLPVFINCCPANKHTKREEIKQLISTISKDSKIAPENIFKAITSPERYNLFNKDYE